MPYHTLRHIGMSFWLFSNVTEHLGESVAPDGAGMDQYVSATEWRLFQNIQNLQTVAEPPARPQEVCYSALDQEHIHATVEVQVPVFGHGSWLGAEPGEENKEWTGAGGRVGRWI